MASSSKDSPTPPKDLLAIELRAIRMGISSGLTLLQEQKQLQQKQLEQLSELNRLIDGFTSSGSSFRSYQTDPMVIVYASILGPILGDRLDSVVAKAADYEDLMIKGAIPYARRLLRELDAYQERGDGRSYLEHVAGDIRPPTDPPAAAST